MELVKETTGFWMPWTGNVNNKLEEIKIALDKNDLQEAVSCMFDVTNSLTDDIEIDKYIEDFGAGEIIKDAIEDIIEDGEEYTLNGDITTTKDLDEDKWYWWKTDMENNILVLDLDKENIQDVYNGIKTYLNK